MGDPAGGSGPVLVLQVRRKRRTSIVRIAFLIICAYAGVCLLVWLFQARLIYFPSREYDFTPADVGLEYEDLTIRTYDGVSIAAWHVAHPAAKGTVLFCHGNAGNISDRVGDLKEFHNLGYNVLIFDYRGFGKSEGSPDEAGTYLDAEAAWQYLVETRNESPGRIIIFGRSLGGAVAIELACRRTPAALVVESTFTTLADIGRIHYRFLPVKWLLTNRYESISKVGGITCPKLFAHGMDDRLIPIALGRKLYEAAVPPKRFLETPGGHGSAGVTYSTEFIEMLAEFLNAVVSM